MYLELLRAWNDGNGRLQHLGLVVDDKGAERGAEDGDQFERKRMEDNADVSTMEDVDTEDANHGKQPADEDEHGVALECV